MRQLSQKKKGLFPVSVLLQKTRRFKRLLEGTGGYPPDLKELVRVLSEVTEASCYLLDRLGRILGLALVPGLVCDVVDEFVYRREGFPGEYNDHLLRVATTSANLGQAGGTCVFRAGEARCPQCRHAVVAAAPVEAAGQRLGTLLLARSAAAFSEADLFFAEWAAVVAGRELLRYEAEEIQREAQSRAAVRRVVAALSYSELQAVAIIFAELGGRREAILGTGKLADCAGIARTAFVQALRKLKTAGLVEVRSLGMKGTYIRLLNEHLTEELGRMMRPPFRAARLLPAADASASLS